MGRFCPFIKGDCVKEECRWWMISTTECAVHAVGSLAVEKLAEVVSVA